MAIKVDKYLRAPPDGGWGWLIVVGGLYCMAMWGGILRCYSVFFSEMMAEFDADYATVAWLNGMFQITYGIFNVIGPVLMHRWERRWLCLISAVIGSLSCFLASFMQQLWAVQVLMGMLVGANMGIISISMFTAINRYFKKKVHMANQLLCLGVSAGPLLICPGYQYLVLTFGWRGACRIIAGMFLNMAVAGALLRPIKLQSDLDFYDEEIKENSELTDECSETENLHTKNLEDIRSIDIEILGSQSLGNYTPSLNRKTLDKNRNVRNHCEKKALTLSSGDVHDSSDDADDSKLRRFYKKYYLELFIDKRFYIYTLSWTTFAAAYFSANTYIIPYGKTNLGLTEYEASTLVSAFAGGEIFSRVVYTLFFDRMPQRLRILYICFLYGLLSVVVLILAFVRNYVGAIICSVLIGALGGGTDGIYSAFIGEIFDIQQYAFVFGYSNIITHSTGTIVTIIIGVAIDRFQDVAVAFYFGCGFAATASVLVFLLHKAVETRRKKLLNN